MNELDPLAAPDVEATNEVLKQADLPTRHEGGPPTHILWRDDSFEIVNLDGYDPANPNLLTIPADFDPLWSKPDFGSRTFTVDLLAARQRKWDRVKGLRDQFELGLEETILTPDGWLQVDEKSQSRMMKATKVAEIMAKNGMTAFSTTWTMADNTPLPNVTAEKIEQWGLIIGQQSEHVFSKARALRETLDAAQTVEELDAIDIESGWLAGGGDAGSL